MFEIEMKLLELEELLRIIPQECKGNSPQASINRRKFVKITSTIHDLLYKLNEIDKKI